MDEHEDNDFLGNNVRKKKRKFHPDLWGKAPVQEVSTLPCGNDGYRSTRVKRAQPHVESAVVQLSTSLVLDDDTYKKAREA